MAITFAGQRLIPAPFIELNKTFNDTADQTIVGSTFNITLNGEFLVNMGSPTSSGTFYDVAYSYPPNEPTVNANDWMNILIAKQEALRTLFNSANDGSSFTVEGYNNNSYLLCNPRIKNISFPQNGNPRGSVSWAYIGDYRVVLEADTVYLNGQNIGEDASGLPGNYKIENASENWSIDVQNEDLQIFKLNHQLSAKGKKFYSSSGTLDQQPWQNAQAWVLPKLGIDNSVLYSSGVLNLTGVSGYNYWRNQKIGKLDGTFEANEWWLAFNASALAAPAYEEFDVDSKVEMNGQATVSLKGKINGLELRVTSGNRPVISTKYQNALTQFSSVQNLFYVRATGISTIILHPTPLSYTIGQNTFTGVISYDYQYDNRPSPDLAGSVSESIDVSFEYPVDIFAKLTVLGRMAGPVFQSIGASGNYAKNATIEAIFPAKTQIFNPTKPITDTLVASLEPNSYTWIFKNKDTENWDQNKGRYSRQLQWEYGN